jgi:proteasome component ECM29
MELLEFPAEDLHKAVVSILVDSKDDSLLDAAYQSLGYLGIWSIYGALMRFPVAISSSETEIGADTIVQRLSSKAKAGNDRAILALGRFSTWFDEDKDESLLLQTYETLRACHEVRRVESQLPVGESLSCAAFGARSGALKTEFDDENTVTNTKTRAAFADRILDETIKGCFQPKPALRRASVIWLQSLVEFASNHASVQSRLGECQRAFRSNLGNREVLVQEGAANGLCLVYGMADRDLKDILVRDLISSFSENKSSLAGTVSEDTQLFDEGDLPTKDGSVSTYGDILNLAQEVGDPSLVYRFMSMASNSAIWSSRAAFGKFGLSQILSDSSADGYLAQNPKLFPALYRYMFDPNPNVQRSMRSLWQSLVKDQPSTLDQHFNLIIEDLLKNVVGPEWRSREASCRAIGDLVQDRDVRLYEQYLDEIWKSCSMVMDDIKGSVRLAAMQLAKTLSSILVRKIESPEASDEAAKMLKHVIPFLLSGSGVESGVKETQAWAVSTLLQIIKKGNRRLMGPYATAILDSFIPLFSSMEPDVVNYLHLNASGYNLTTQEIDESRLKFSVRHSPLMEGIEKLIDTSYGPDIDRQIVSVVEKQTKSSLGMPAQTATSRLLVTMFVRNHLRFKDFADPLLVAAQKPMLDRNETVGNSYAYAAGYLCRYASDKQILKTAEFAWKLWSTSDDPRHRSIAAEVFYSISKHATDRFSHLSVKLLPLVFLGKHDDQEDVKETFSKTWSEVAGGQRAVLFHLDSICQLAVPMLDDPKWTLKHAGARAIADAAEAVAGLDALAAAADAPKIWPALSKALGGRSWEGKDAILESFGTFFEKVKPFIDENPDAGNEMTKVR